MRERLQQNWREVASGERRGIAAGVVRGALWAACLPYGAAAWWRNRGYDRGRYAVTRVDVPVICVGNLTVGGVGKTPMVKWVARRLRSWDVRVAILSRGYGAEAGARNDEGLELELDLPDVPHLQHPDRAAAAEVAIEELGMEALVLDDGFQHRRLARDLDVVLLDATSPFGFGHCLPRGALRESPRGLRRAGAVVLTRADMLAAERRAVVQREAARLAPQAAWAEAVHRPTCLVDAAGAASDLCGLRGARVAAFCGVGNPAGFRHTLEHLGAELATFRPLPDHHNYTRDDVDALAEAARSARAELVVCTRKDLVKLQAQRLGDLPLRAVAVEIGFLAGEAELAERLAGAVGRSAADRG